MSFVWISRMPLPPAHPSHAQHAVASITTLAGLLHPPLVSIGLPALPPRPLLAGDDGEGAYQLTRRGPPWRRSSGSDSARRDLVGGVVARGAAAAGRGMQGEER